jgi:hypothetical protein
LSGSIGSPSWTSSLLLVLGKEIGFGGNTISNLKTFGFVKKPNWDSSKRTSLDTMIFVTKDYNT